MSCILPCAECTQTNNHCCKADIPYTLVDALHIKWLITDKYKIANREDIVIGNHPAVNLQDKDLYFVFNSKDITTGSTVDIRTHNCPAMVDGKCGIYDDRPNICRQYGTEFMRCRYECSGITTKEQIMVLDMNSVKMLDSFANDSSLIKQVYLTESNKNSN